jgi:hypothetical protein
MREKDKREREREVYHESFREGKEDGMLSWWRRRAASALDILQSKGWDGAKHKGGHGGSTTIER